MAKNAVEQYMHVGSVQEPGAVHVEAEEVIGIKADIGRVSPYRRGREVHNESQAVERRSQKAHGEIEFCPRSVQNLFSHLVQFYSVSHFIIPSGQFVLPSAFLYCRRESVF